MNYFDIKRYFSKKKKKYKSVEEHSIEITKISIQFLMSEPLDFSSINQIHLQIQDLLKKK